jgi:hypothetical protein
LYAPQTLFRHFSVFAGGATLEAVGPLNGDTPPDEHGDSDALEGLAVLLDHSLLDRTDEASREPRCRMLETIREYAGELLAASGERFATERAHAAYYLALTEAAEESLSIWRELGDDMGCALTSLGCVALFQGDYARSRPLKARRFDRAGYCRDPGLRLIATATLGVDRDCTRTARFCRQASVWPKELKEPEATLLPAPAARSVQTRVALAISR